MGENMENWRLSRIQEELENLAIFENPYAFIDDDANQNVDKSTSSGSPVRTKPTATVSPAKRSTSPVDIFYDEDIEKDADDKYRTMDDQQPIYVVVSNNVTYEEIPADKMDKQKERDAVDKIAIKYDSMQGHIHPSSGSLYTSPSEYSCSDGAYSGDSVCDESIVYAVSSPTEPVLPYDMSPLTEDDIQQVGGFYRSLATEVFVAQGIVSLYFGDASDDKDQWEFSSVGVPLFVLDTGESRRRRKLHIVVAERGTGFVLWRDSIDHLSNYRATQNTFHTLSLSTDHSRVAGLSFMDSSSAQDFLRTFTDLTSDPEDDLLNVSKKSKKKKKDKTKTKKAKPKKTDISQPCCFTHVIKVDRNDKERVPTLSAVIEDNIAASKNISGISRSSIIPGNTELTS